MTQEITASIDNLFQQSKYTAEDYLCHACNHLDKCDFKNLEFEDYMRFAELSAYDFRSSMIALGLQNLSESLERISESLQNNDD